MDDQHFFIVFEGLDGAGTTTQTGRLHEYLTSRGLGSFVTFEPTSGPVGGFIRDILGGRISHDGEPFRPGEESMALLFAADRLAHTGTVNAQLEAGNHVVCDRYVLSSMAYQSLDPSMSAERVVELNRGCAIPHLTFLLSVPVDVCLERLSGRGDSPSIYEKGDFLRTIAGNYGRLVGLYESLFGELIVIDGSSTPDEVHAACVRELEKRIG